MNASEYHPGLSACGIAICLLGLTGCAAPADHLQQPSKSKSQAASGFFPPLTYPAGERRPYWKAGLGTRRLESLSDVRVLGDGSRIYTFTCLNQPPLYVWDRVSTQYNSPAVASHYSNFWIYATLDLENLAFLENIHTQILRILPEPQSPEHDRLVSKLSDAIHDARRSTDGH